MELKQGTYRLNGREYGCQKARNGEWLLLAPHEPLPSFTIMADGTIKSLIPTIKQVPADESSLGVQLGIVDEGSPVTQIGIATPQTDFTVADLEFLGMIEPAAMECHICRREFEQLRSAKIRCFGKVVKGPDGFDRFEDVPSLPPEDRQYARRFICEQCYKAIDNEQGMAGVETPHNPGLVLAWNIAGVSRGDAAAIYSRVKWAKHRTKEAAQAG